MTHPAWKYGFDDGPALAVDMRTGDVYVAFTRSLSINHATTQWSVSRDHGATWSAPATVSRSLVRPHLASLAVASDGDVYLAGIDAAHGIWIARSTDGARSFGAPVRAAPLVQNPAFGCALSAYSPLPQEDRLCIGPDPTVAVAQGHRSTSSSATRGANGAGDVFLAALTPELRPFVPDTGEPGRQGEDRPVPAGGGGRPLDGEALGLLVRHDIRPARAPGLVHVLRLPRRPDVDAAGARGDACRPRPWISSASPRRTGSTRRSRRRGGAAHPLWPDGRAIPLSIDVFTAATALTAGKLCCKPH